MSKTWAGYWSCRHCNALSPRSRETWNFFTVSESHSYRSETLWPSPSKSFIPKATPCSVFSEVYDHQISLLPCPDSTFFCCKLQISFSFYICKWQGTVFTFVFLIFVVFSQIFTTICRMSNMVNFTRGLKSPSEPPFCQYLATAILSMLSPYQGHFQRILSRLFLQM